MASKMLKAVTAFVVAVALLAPAAHAYSLVTCADLTITSKWTGGVCGSLMVHNPASTPSDSWAGVFHYDGITLTSGPTGNGRAFSEDDGAVSFVPVDVAQEAIWPDSTVAVTFCGTLDAFTRLRVRFEVMFGFLEQPVLSGTVDPAKVLEAPPCPMLNFYGLATHDPPPAPGAPQTPAPSPSAQPSDSPTPDSSGFNPSEGVGGWLFAPPKGNTASVSPAPEADQPAPAPHDAPAPHEAPAPGPQESAAGFYDAYQTGDQEWL